MSPRKAEPADHDDDTTADLAPVSDLHEGDPDDEPADELADLDAAADDSDAADEADDAADYSDSGEKVHFDADEPLLTDAEEYRSRWLAIQTGFVDEPLYAVESAGRLLTEVLGDLASTFAHKRTALERQWRHDGDTSTDDLRAAFQAYRAFFNRVVST